MGFHSQRNTFTTVSTSEAICVLSSSDGFGGKNGVHGTAHNKSVRVLAVAIVFCTVMMIVEGVGGVVAHSLAVLSDAVHMLADVFALSISLFAAYSAQWEGNHVYSFGWRRAEVIGALISVITTWGLVVWISLSALERTYTIARCAHQITDNAHQSTSDECEVLSTPLMIVLGTFGFAMNIVLAVILHWGNVHAHSHGGLRTCVERNEHYHHDYHNEEHLHHWHHYNSPEPTHVQCKHENKVEQEMCSVHDHANVRPEAQDNNTSYTNNLINYEEEEEYEEWEQNKMEWNKECKTPDASSIDRSKLRVINECASCCDECHQSNHKKQYSISQQLSREEHPEQAQSESFCVSVQLHNKHVSGVYVEVDDDDDDKEDHFDNNAESEHVAYNNANNDHDLEHHHEHDHCEGSHSMNVRAALIHVLGDCLQALGVVLAALAMYCGNYITHHTHSSAHSYYNLADPLLSLLFGVITIFTTKRLIRDVLEVLMERVPDDNLYENVLHMMCSREEVENVQDIHIWTIGPGLVMLCATVIVTTSLSAHNAQELLDVMTEKCKEMGIHHCTIQITYQLTQSDEEDDEHHVLVESELE